MNEDVEEQRERIELDRLEKAKEKCTVELGSLSEQATKRD